MNRYVPRPIYKSTDGSEIHPYHRDTIGRRALPHEPPSWVDRTKEIYFITVCCKCRNENQLCHRNIASKLFEAARFYEAEHRWSVPLMLLMPDHVHFLVRFATDARMKNTVSNWKRYTSIHAPIEWQRDFFDHRLRGEEARRRKTDYVLHNPVRARLVKAWQEWPYIMMLE